jgi:hypothetical protein
MALMVVRLLGAAEPAGQAAATPPPHWAFSPVRKPALPPTRSGSKVNPIDRFIVAALKSRGLSLSPPVQRREWIRRVTLDLTGLPPTWEEVAAFVSDRTPNAEEKVVDRLLSSPRYGERWGRHWLDLARYADTHGGSAIGFTKFPFSYTYRDYVIRAFNADVPYDRFVLEQVAADQLGLKENDPALAGLGFLTVGMQYRNRHDVIDDQIDVISRGLQGLTVACARCHDHKFDPIPTRDYYSLYAALAGSHAPRRLPVLGPASNPGAFPDYEQELARRQTIYDDLAREQVEVMRARLRLQVGLYLREILKGTPEQDTSTGFLSYRTDDIRPIVFNRWRAYLQAMPASDAVFGPWVRLAALEKPGTNAAPAFREACSNLVQTLRKENGDPAAVKEAHKLSVGAPRWNPRVLTALETRSPGSMMDVADAYGALFAEVEQAWMKGVQAAAGEAVPGAEIIPDEDGRHQEINSAVERQLRHHLHATNTPTAVPDDLATQLLNRPVNDDLAGRAGAIEELHLNAPGSPPRAMVLEEDPSPGLFHVLRRGNPLDRGPVAAPGFLSILSPRDPVPFPDGHRRLGLARAIVSPDNPLTRRVLVNWVWQHHFGQGLVKTPDDWGTRAAKPVQFDLLDFLASRFAEQGWSIKWLHREIVLSAVYHQGAVEQSRARMLDADNELFWRMPRQRLELEAMRDSLLAVAGELDLTAGGQPFDLQAQPAVLRRTVYGFINRDIVSTLASTFDAANPSACTARRPETTVPQQTLFALNSEFIQDRAKAVAARALREAGADDAARVRQLYRRALSRDPARGEIDVALDYIHKTAGTNPDAAWSRLAHALLASNEFVFLD